MHNILVRIIALGEFAQTGSNTKALTGKRRGCRLLRGVQHRSAGLAPLLPLVLEVSESARQKPAPKQTTNINACIGSALTGNAPAWAPRRAQPASARRGAAVWRAGRRAAPAAQRVRAGRKGRRTDARPAAWQRPSARPEEFEATTGAVAVLWCIGRLHDLRLSEFRRSETVGIQKI